MKIRQTKNQLIFQPLGIMEQLVYRWDEHFRIHQRHPTRIFLNADQYGEFCNSFSEDLMNSLAIGPKLHFRGTEVILKQ